MNVLSTAARSLYLITFGCISSLSASASAQSWRADLPWDTLKAKLSSSASLIDTGFEDYSSECTPEFVNFDISERSNYGLIDQPSGLCLNFLSCAYDTCNSRPSVNGHANVTFDQYLQDMEAMNSEPGGVPPDSFNPAKQDSYFNHPSNPSLNLPSKVLFPVVASDVIAAVQFAKEHGVELSVKNSGSSWQGASTKADTLLINMNRYTRYAPTGITDCDAQSLGITIKDDLSDQPCHLSVAKNKPAVIRVGGGENWDKTYRAVVSANDAQEDGWKYHIVGGGDGTVSPMGWTFQGGLSGSTAGHLYGLGVDQVLQIEMVLPNGYHVKFGPVEWEDASEEGFIVPRTTGVKGLCHSNPEEQDENNWTWQTCPDDFDIAFMDLWYAVRGGGGGTYGIVLSMYLQLHDYIPQIQEYWPSDSEECVSMLFSGDFGLGGMEQILPPGRIRITWHPLWREFHATYAITPSVLNVTKQMSNACGQPGFAYIFLYCFGDEDVVRAWSTFLRMNNITGGIECLAKITDDSGGVMASVNPPGHRFEGHNAANSIVPLTSPQFTSSTGVLIPRSWVEQVGAKTLVTTIQYIAQYLAFGAASTTSDQANSVSQAHRDAGVMLMFLDTDGESFWRDIAPKLFDFTDKTKFPPMFGSNHAGPVTAGPRKDDWSQPCPVDWTLEERYAGCVSHQESIFGTERLQRLEEIKKVVDPNFMFDCASCVGNNRFKVEEEEAATTQEEDVAREEGSDTTQGSTPVSNASYLYILSYLALAMIAGLHVNIF